MLQATDVTGFARQPVERYVAGRSWVHFCVHAELFGVVLFGRPDRGDTDALVESLHAELQDGVAPHRSLVDARRLDGIDPAAFESLQRYVRDRHRELARQVTSLALVRPHGVAGAVVAGFYGVLDPPYPFMVFEEPAAALAWLDEEPAIAGALATIVDAVVHEDPIVGKLRALLAARLDAPIDIASQTLGTSARTLQRRLRDAGTSYGQIVLAARLQEAQRRMLECDDSLSAIALAVGFASPQHFFTQFRKATRESPGEWRRRRRGSPP
jgi:AraC-like DNA-binding protein